jgi:hypothetical protein
MLPRRSPGRPGTPGRAKIRAVPRTRSLDELDQVLVGLRTKDWGTSIELPLGAVSKTVNAKFVREVERRLANTLAA